MGIKAIFLVGVCCGASALTPVLAKAQSAPDLDKIDRLQRQVEQLQEQLKSRTEQLQEQLKLMKREMAQTKKKAIQSEELQGAYAADAPAGAKPQNVRTPAPAPTAVAKMSANNRPSICTADGENCIGLTSRVYFDAGGYSYHPNSTATTVRDLNDGVNVRQARIGVLGTFLSDWNYALVYDFGSSGNRVGDFGDCISR